MPHMIIAASFFSLRKTLGRFPTGAKSGTGNYHKRMNFHCKQPSNLGIGRAEETMQETPERKTTYERI